MDRKYENQTLRATFGKVYDLKSMPKLPSNCRINKGYLEGRIYFRGRKYVKHFGLDSPEARAAAADWVHSLKHQIRLNKLGVEEPLVRVRFGQAADLFYAHWYENDPKRSHLSKLNARSMRDILKAYFKDMPLDAFTVEHIKQWRYDSERIVKFNTVNRRQAFLHSLFERFSYWNKLGASSPIAPVKLPHPHYNPVALVEKPTEEGENRRRACSIDELKRLKAACHHWHDDALWRAIQKAIHTMLRQKDLITVEPGEYIKLYQGKTGKPIIIPVCMTEKINATNLRNRWDRVRITAECADLQWRDLRRSGATLLKELGYGQELIRDALGHQNQSTTDKYTNIKVQRLKPALAEIGEMLENL